MGLIVSVVTSAKTALEMQTSQLTLLMQQCMGSVRMNVAISWPNKME